MGIYAVTVQADCHFRRSPDEVFQNRQMLTGKVWETVYVKHMVFSKRSLFQLFQKQGLQITRVTTTLRTKRIIALHQQRQLFQLLGKTSLCCFRSSHQICTGDAAALEFIHRINQPRQKFRLCFNSGIGLQAAGKLTGRRSHGNNPSTLIQTFCRR